MSFKSECNHLCFKSSWFLPQPLFLKFAIFMSFPKPTAVKPADLESAGIPLARCSSKVAREMLLEFMDVGSSGNTVSLLSSSGSFALASAGE